MRSCLALLALVAISACRDSHPSVPALSAWPINLSDVMSSVEKQSGCRVRLKSPDANTATMAYGCVLCVDGDQRKRAETNFEQIGAAVYSSICDSLKSRGFRILSTRATSCKTDYRFVYENQSCHGSVTSKVVYAKRMANRFEIYLELLGDERPTRSAEQIMDGNRG